MALQSERQAKMIVFLHFLIKTAGSAMLRTELHPVVGSIRYDQLYVA